MVEIKKYKSIIMITNAPTIQRYLIFSFADLVILSVMLPTELCALPLFSSSGIFVLGFSSEIKLLNAEEMAFLGLRRSLTVSEIYFSP
jgi:ribosomal protein L30E